MLITALLFSSMAFSAVENNAAVRQVNFVEKVGSLPIDQLVVREVVQKNRGDIRSCYERELIKNANLRGKVVVQWDIDSRGTVKRIDLKDTTLNNYRVERCLASKILGWNFPAAPQGHISRVTYPFEFSTLEQ